MKFEQNPKYTKIAIYVLLVLIIAMILQQAFQGVGALFSFAGKVIGFVMPVIYGVVFAFLLNPLLRWIERIVLPRVTGNRFSRSVNRAIGMVITYLIAIAAVTAFIAIVLPQMINSIFKMNLPLYIKFLTLWYQNAITAIDGFLSANIAPEAYDVAVELMNNALPSISSIAGMLNEVLQNSLMKLLSLTTSLATGLVNLVLGVIVSIYILLDREKLFAQFRKIGRAIFSKNVYGLISDIVLDINRIFSGFVVGKVIDSLIIGILCMIGMTILRLPYAVLISVIVGVTNVIPYFGPFIGAIPGIIIIFITSPLKALFFLIFIFLLQQLDGNVIGPKILGDTIGLSPLWIIFSIMLFSGLMGIVGMFIGVPLFAIIYSLIKRLIAFLLRRKGESSNTRDYASEKNPLIK